METMYERSKDILQLKSIQNVDELPPFQKNQKILVEFARDAALHIITTQTAEDSADKLIQCPKCGYAKDSWSCKASHG